MKFVVPPVDASAFFSISIKFTAANTYNDTKAELGANAMLAVSIAACKAGAAEKEVSLYKHISDLSGKSSTTLPVPAITVISGGKHAGNNLPVQEVMIFPVGASNFEEAMQMGLRPIIT